MATKNPTRKAKKIAEMLICQALQETVETQTSKENGKTKNKAKGSKNSRKLEAQEIPETQVLFDVEAIYKTEPLLLHNEDDNCPEDKLIKQELIQGELKKDTDVSLNSAGSLIYSEMGIKEEPACELDALPMDEEANNAIDPLINLLMDDEKKAVRSNKDIKHHEVENQMETEDDGTKGIHEKMAKVKRKRNKNETGSNKKRCSMLAQRQRERRAKEAPEKTEARRLRQRILTMKNRLAARIFGSEKLLEERKQNAAKVRLKRKKMREVETPEETAARKRSQSLQLKLSRSRLIAIETPEETAARRVRERLYNKNYRLKRISDETPEKRAARKERERAYREKHKGNKLSEEQHTTEQLKPMTTDVSESKTGIEQ